MKDDRYADILKNVEKPGRYCGGEFGELQERDESKTRFAFCFPDTYEIGMSNLGMRILVGSLNNSGFICCERCFAPWCDMEKQLRDNNIPLFALESGDPLTDFDILGITLQYELSYTNALNMLSLAGIPLFASERGEEFPLIIGGGPCTYNPEPIADFFDLFSIGEGENALVEISRLYRDCKNSGMTKREFLKKAAELEGVYVPSLYDVEYNEDGTIKSFKPNCPEAKEKITKTIIEDLDSAYFPTCQVVPYLEVVHDRIMLEVFRGCIRGCRFCQAGMVYRPYREKSAEVLNEQGKKLFDATGYGEISLLALSISDYSEIRKLVDSLLEWTKDKKVSLSLPSMRVDSFYEELIKKTMSIRQSGLTFAPEAGTQRLRDVINKNITENDIITACAAAFDGNRSTIKLYFMNGLPTETDEDIKGIAELSQKIVDLYFSKKRQHTKGGVQVNVSVSCLVPKPFTPFQWEPQDDIDNLMRKQQLLRSSITSRKISYSYHDAQVSRIEAVFARGDRRLSAALAEACARNQRFDSWDEFFSYENWLSIFESVGIDPSFYANRRIAYDEILPWDHIDCFVKKEFLIQESKKAYEQVTTPDCRTKCSNCGAQKHCSIHKCVKKEG